MDMYNPFPVKINSDGLFAKFLEKNKKKIPQDVIVERVESSHHVLQNNSDEGTLVIHAFALSLGLYLPLNPVISEILSYRGLDPIKLVPNCWRIMFSILALNQYFCKTKLGWKEFCYCYVVKKNAAGLYYFSPRKKEYALVENLPNSEKGWQDVYISLKGNWGGARNIENTSCQSAGADYSCSKPADWEVNSNDLKKAWSFENKDWRYLLDPANWRNDGATVAGSSLLTEAREEVTSKEVIISSLQNTDNEVVEQPGAETGLVDDQMTTNVPLSFQPHSKKQRTIHDSGSGGVAHDDYRIMNLESIPDTRVCGGQQDAGDLLSHQILPNHSHIHSTDNIPPQLQHSLTPRAGIELSKQTMNTSRSSLFSAEHKSDGEFHRLEKAIGKLPVGDETGLGLARSLEMVLMSQDRKNKTIKELEAKNERLEKELAASKSGTCKEPVGAVTEDGKSPTAEQFECLKKDIDAMWSDLTQKTKLIDVMWSDLTQKTKLIEGLRSDLTQLKEMRSETINESEAKIERLEKELAESKSARCEDRDGAVTEHGKSPTAEQFKYPPKVVEEMWPLENIIELPNRNWLFGLLNLVIGLMNFLIRQIH